MSRRVAAAALILLLLPLACSPDSASENVTGAEGGAARAGHRVASGSGAHAKRPWRQAACTLPHRFVRLIDRGTHPQRSHDVMIVPRRPNVFGSFRITTHSGPWPYLQRVPLVLYGRGFVARRGTIRMQHDASVADLAPTLADLLRVAWPRGRAGRSLEELLLPPRARAGRPRMILVIVWDGGGWNVLRRWDRAWPNLARLIRGGASVDDAVVGSSPSVTPAIHATIGTGTWPKQHGIVDLHLRGAGGGLRSSFASDSPRDLLVATLADIYDRTTGNDAKVGMLGAYAWHLGMLGHGALAPGGDRDIAVMGDGSAGDNHTTRAFYRLPSFIDRVAGLSDDVRAVDLEDGRLDERWLGNPVLSSAERWVDTPVQIRYQTRQLISLFRRERFGQDDVPDLFYVNYKQLDRVGHLYNMLNEEVESALAATDHALGRLVRFLDASVGRDRWVVAVTADHGQTPSPLAVGGWPIDITELQKDAARHFGTTPDDLFEAARVTGLWLDRAGMARAGVTVGEVADWITGYRLEENVTAPADVPQKYKARMGEPLFAAAFPTAAMGEVASCTARR
jgi:hypothetical protein